MLKKFAKKELIQRLGMSEELAKKVMDAQRRFPSLLTTEEQEGFPIDGETLCNELGVKDHFTKWLLENRTDDNGKIKSQGKLIKYRCIEGVDYHLGESPTVSKGTPKKIISLNLHTAKKIAMRQNNDQGDLICDYFIILEEAIKDMDKWYEARHPEKMGYKSMCAMLEKQYMDSHDGKKPNFHIYTNNADMINLCMFGKKSKEMKQILDVEYEDLLRDSLTTQANKAISEVQLLNENLVLSNVDFQTRKQIITNTCNAKYMDIRVKVVSEFHKELMNVGDK
jgi:phage anti-repressor protein